MKQKITLEIENDTGVEFEETINFDTPKKGDYFITNSWGKPVIDKWERDWKRKDCIFPILTPKIDKELEEARKKFPVGSYFKTTYPDYDDFILPVTSVEDRGGFGINIWSGKNGNTAIPCPIERCTPFPLPVWRCCESDKPKKDRVYPTRNKINTNDYNLLHFRNGRWNDPQPSHYEWLDEGGAE